MSSDQCALVLLATDGNAYVRRSAQSFRLNAEGLAQLKYDKGLTSFEDEPVNVEIEEITTSEKIGKFLLDVVPTAEPRSWLEKQRVLVAGRPNVDASKNVRFNARGERGVITPALAA